MSEHFDAIVVGSGFGGSVSAYRLADAGLSVCLLERGKAYPPGSFPRTPDDVSRNLWDPSEGLHGMFDLWTFAGIEALVSSALGGGSIIYANVLLRKDERWFVNEAGEDWPVTRADLDPHYDAVEAMMKPQRYPFETEPYSRTPKTIAMQEAGRQLGVGWQLPNLAVTFANPDRPPIPGEPIVESENLHRRQRFTCRLCGECNVGCNYGSKNTLDFNYLTAFAALDGAEIRQRSEVRSFAPRPEGGYSVRYVVHEASSEGRPTDTSRLPERTITADRLVLSAGALGTPYLLLRNLDAFPRVSRKALGTRFSGNGDLLAFLTKSRKREDGRIVGTELEPSIGPVITSALRWPDALDGGKGRGFYVEDGGYPHFVSWMAEVADSPGRLRRGAAYAWRRVHNRFVERPVSNVTGELAQLIGGGAVSSGAMPMLGMGRDVPDGVMRLKGRYLEVDWTTSTSKQYFEGVREGMRGMARVLGARFEDNPLWYFHRVITVHPLGGCPIGRSGDTGVVDSYGQVFGHPGLSIADGSVMPGPVGPNPSLTIAALADRFADRIVEEATAVKRATRAA